MRAANVIGRLLNGQSLTSPGIKTDFKGRQHPLGNQRDNNDSNSNDGFTDYEDVTDEDEKK